LRDGPFYAANQEWLDILSGGSSYRLTEKGFLEAGENDMNLSAKCNEKITVERQDGTRHEDVSSLVTDNMVLVPDGKIPISAGDALLRELPSGIVERLVVTSPGFHAGVHGFPPHYQIKYRHEGQGQAGTPGYAVHVSGPNSRVNIGSVDNSTNMVSYVSQNMEGLADELARLRAALLTKAQSPEDYAALGAVAGAEVAAKAGDASRVSQALSNLGSAGKWALGVAKDIGVEIAAGVLAKSIGG
jgi:hypothetical protein